LAEALGRKRHQPNALVGLVYDNALALQDPKGLPNRDPAHFKTPSDIRFYNPVARQDQSANCRGHDGLDYKVNQGSRPQRLPALFWKVRCHSAS
jgi:hypothetical protein